MSTTRNLEWYVTRAEELGAEKLDLDTAFRNILGVRPIEGKIVMRKLLTHHTNFESILNCIKNNLPFNIIAGFSPVKKLHLGHTAAIDAVKYFQENYNAGAFISIADLDGVLAKNVSIEQTSKDAKPFLDQFKALGLDVRKTHFIVESQNTFNCLKNSFWISRFIEDSDFTSHYAGEIPKTFRQKNGLLVAFGDMYTPFFLNGNPTLVVMGIDEARHIALISKIHERIRNFYPQIPPLAAVYTLTVKGLNNLKMSKRDDEGVISLDESPEIAFKKVMKSDSTDFGNPLNCAPYQFGLLQTIEDENWLKNCFNECKGKSRNCDTCKEFLANSLASWLRKIK